MSEKKPAHREGDVEERLTKRLRELQKLKAPWFFEAELQRRLHEGTTHASSWRFFARPIPAYALSVLGIVLIGVVGYFMMVRTPQVEPFIIEVPIETNEAVTDQPTSEPPQQLRSQANEEPHPMNVGPSGRGPSSGTLGSTIEAKIEENRANSDAHPVSESEFEIALPQDANNPTVTNPLYDSGLQRATGATSNSFDSLKWHQTSRDSLDSLKRQADTLGKKPLDPLRK